MRRVLVTLLAGLLAGPAFAQSGATDCDALAGYVHTPRLPGLAGATLILDPAAAVAACERDALAAGADPFLGFLLARAYEALDPQDGRIPILLVQAAEAYPVFGASRLALLHEQALGGVAHDPARARALNEQSCAALPDPQALAGCNNLGLTLLYGEGDEVDRGADLLQQICDLGFAVACANLAGHLGGEGVLSADPVRQAALNIQACEGGAVEVCAYSGYALQIGEGVAQDVPRAMRHYDLGCVLGDPYACYALGLALVYGDDLPRDWPGGMARLATACDGGMDEACYERGLELVYGMDQAGDVTDEGQAEAVAHFARLCDLHHARSCTELGFLQQAGTAMPQDSALAAGFSARACVLGDPMGCNNLGVHFGLGEGVPLDLQRAAGYYRQACDLGTGLGCANLAELLAGDALGPPDPEAARALNRQACDLGEAEACALAE